MKTIHILDLASLTGTTYWQLASAIYRGRVTRAEVKGRGRNRPMVIAIDQKLVDFMRERGTELPAELFGDTPPETTQPMAEALSLEATSELTGLSADEIITLAAQGQLDLSRGPGDLSVVANEKLSGFLSEEGQEEPAAEPVSEEPTSTTWGVSDARVQGSQDLLEQAEVLEVEAAQHRARARTLEMQAERLRSTFDVDTHAARNI